MKTGQRNVKQGQADPQFAWLRDALQAASGTYRCTQEQRAFCLREGLGPLLVGRIAEDAELQSATRQLAMREMAHQNALMRLAQACESHSLRLLVFKGEALARTVYAQAHTRERSDIDLWVHAGQLALLTQVLTELGMPALHDIQQQWARFELVHAQTTPPSVGFDVHLHPFFRPRLLPQLDFDSVWDQSQALPGLQPLRAPNANNAFLLAALHLAKNSHKRAIWLYDLHLLAQLQPDAVRQACAQSVTWQVASLVADAMTRCIAVFDTEFPCALPEPRAAEAATSMLESLSRWQALKRDMRFIPNLRSRLQFIRELLQRPN